jgi:photosystem II stability/assembly factor-like uncharacterized protein
MKHLDTNSILLPLAKKGGLTLLTCLLILLSVHLVSYGQWKQAVGVGNTYIGGLTDYTYGSITVLAAEGGMSTPDTVWFSTDNGQTWAIRSDSVTILASALAYSGTSIVVGSGNPGGILWSSDAGKTWSPDTTGFLNDPNASLQYYVNSLATLGTTVYAGTGLGVCQQTQPGQKWTADTLTANGLGALPIEQLIASGSDLFAEVAFEGYFLSTNGGSNWATANTGLPASGLFVAAGKTALSGTTMYTVTTDTANGGYSIDFYSTQTAPIKWSRTNTTPVLASGVFDIAASGAYVIAVADSGIFVSTDYGVTWTKSNTGLPSFNSNNPFTAVRISGQDVVLGSFSNGIWYRSLSDFAAVRNEVSATSSLLLSESFPNPLNAVSTIQYSLPSNGVASLKVYDVTGKQVAVLTDGYQVAGNHTALLDASTLPSGVYFYRLISGSQSSGRWLQVVR